MRPVQLADIEAAARVLLPLPASERKGRMTQLLAQAHTADRYRQTTGRPHSGFGVGTLMSAAASFPKSSRHSQFTQNELHAFAIVINALLAQQSNQSL